ncbi:MAG: type I glutamate--ammonia ligase [Kouleothrix sp.]|jgi:glutamine synthetase|nr:type I glutamate--ammonia ligase [Kouleothrix sp.]
MPRTNDEIRAIVAAQRIEFINLQFTDIVGMVKNVTIPVQQLADCLDHGVWFDGSSIEGFARVAESDMFLVPDLESYAAIPWDESAGYPTARMICDVFTPDGKPFAGDPRYILKQAVAEATRMGMVYNVGPELEFFLFKTNANGQPVADPHDVAGYFDVSTDLASHIRRQMVRALGAFGIEVEAAHHEVSVGQHEIDFKYGPALRTADHAVTFRTTLKAVAQQQGLYATFMPKPIAGINGSGMHVHQSLSDMKTGRNLFYDAADPYGLSATARHFTAGLLAHAKGMIAILAPLVNSYKRLVPGYEAPVYLSWGRTNRSALVRVPRISPQRIHATRIELRCPDPSCNPYLAFAVMLKAGLDGIKRGLPLPAATEEDLYHVDSRARNLETLPGSLGEALAELERDDVVIEALGPHVLERFVEAKRQEWDAYRIAVSQWEIERYLAVY